MLCIGSAVASMGQGGAIAPPILGVAPPIGSCPGHSRKPAFNNGAIASWEMYKNYKNSVKVI